MLALDTAKNKTCNKNVPENAFLFFETESCSGEIHTSYFADRDGNMFKVIDWVDNKPQPITMSILASFAWINYGISDVTLERAFMAWKENN